MSHRIAAIVSVTHGFWSPAAPPVSVVPDAPEDARRRSVRVKPGQGGQTLVIVDDAAPAGPQDAPLWLAVVPRSPEVAKVTRDYDWHRVPVLEAGARAGDGAGARETLSLSMADAHRPRTGRGAGPLVVIGVTIPPEGCAEIALALDTVEAFWTYNIVGAPAGNGGIRIVDPGGALRFEDLGERALPDGRAARVLRSTAPVPVAARSGLRLRLEQDQPAPFDPLTLVPVLPVAGPDLSPVADAQATAFQSEIFVSLW